MARHYTTREFFRQMPNALLARYFHERQGLFAELDFAAMKETRTDELFAAWLELPDSQRNEMDAEFQSIFEMSCEKGFIAIRDEAEFQLEAEPQALDELMEKLAALANHFERAMVTFLVDPVSSEPLSAGKSLLTGKFTGNFRNFRPQVNGNSALTHCFQGS